MLYLAAIGLTAFAFGRAPSLVAAAYSVLAYNFFFVEPRYTFAVSEQRNLLTFAMMFAVGLLLSGLTAKLREETRLAELRANQTAALYALSRDLGGASDETHAARIGARHAAQLLGTSAAVLLIAPGRSAVCESSSQDFVLGDQELAAAIWATQHSRTAGKGTPAMPDAAVFCLPLRTGTGLETVGALAVQAEAASLDQRRFLEAFSRQLALAVERARWAAQAGQATLKAKTEAMRSSLLSAVSHDLRTPLASITGAATTLLDRTAPLPEAERDDLLRTICGEAERLERLVGNLLDMTRLDAGGLQPKCEWVPLEELVGSALGRLERELKGHAVTVQLHAVLPLLHVDPVLFEQVLINLLENAAKYSPAGGPIEVAAGVGADGLFVDVGDRGPGIPPGAEAKVFDKFFRGPQEAGTAGAGLGLAICKGIVEAHGGRISAQSRSEGGAVFRVLFPLPKAPPP